ncbi:MAG: oligopeptide transporter, OPT family, partial [Proteobacteria bacterium]|nr:oligopeptide transporter, OPT family [Pseudomonadota bacterium]
VIGTAAIWSMIRLVKPLIDGFRATMKARAVQAGANAIHARDDRDIPLWLIVLLSIVCLAMIGWLLHTFIDGGTLSAMSMPLTIGGVIFVVVVGFFIATVAGYMAALIGASNSPVSGIGILATLIGAVLLATFAQPILGQQATRALVAFTLFAVSIVFSVATISNDNLQDLKTGQLVGASPWRQQVALIVGVLAGSLIIPFVLNMLNHAYGFPGDPNRHAVGAPLGAPQATLISTLANGVLNGNVPWDLIGKGVVVGVICIAVDEMFGVLKLVRLPPLAIGISIYLPMSATEPVIIGAICGWLYNRAMDKRSNAEMAKRFGVLLASGLVVGESLLGIVHSGFVAWRNVEHPWALVGADFSGPSNYIGMGLFILFTLYCYWWVSRQSKLS